MISKQLVHKVVTFLNTFNSNKNVVCSIIIWNNRPRINCSIEVWSLDNNDSIVNCVGSIRDVIHNIKEYIDFKEKVNKELPLILKKL